MRYHWDKRDLLKALKDLTLLTSKEEDLEQKSYYLKCIDSFKNFLFSAYSNCPPSRMSTQDKLIAATNSFSANGRFFSIIQKFYDELEPLEDQFISIENRIEGEILDKGQNTFFHSQYLTHENAINLVRDFFRNIDKELFNIFETLYKQRYSSIKFGDVNYTIGENFSSEGNCIFVDGVRKCFITIDGDRNLRKYQNLVHECAHAIAYFTNPKKDFTSNVTYLSEVESIFMELVALTNISNEKKDEASYLLIDILLTNYNKAKALVLQKDAIDAWVLNGYVVDKNYFRILREEYGISKPLFNEVIDEDVELTGKYIICYLVSLTLLHIFNGDKDEALRIYKQLIKSTFQIDEYFYAKSSIDFDAIKMSVSQTVEDAQKLLKKRGV